MDANKYLWRSQRHNGFNPRARDGREAQVKNAVAYDVVSIHAPVMDAKDVLRCEQLGTIVSIHAPVMDANSALT